MLRERWPPWKAGLYGSEVVFTVGTLFPDRWTCIWHILTHIICSEWIKNLTMSTLAFDITQFFSSLNHQLLLLILDKAGLDQRVSIFFKNYLVGRKTKYISNDFIFPSFDINVSIRQGSALSPILSAFYLSPVFYSLEKHLKILKIPISMISFL